MQNIRQIVQTWGREFYIHYGAILICCNSSQCCRPCYAAVIQSAFVIKYSPYVMIRNHAFIYFAFWLTFSICMYFICIVIVQQTICTTRVNVARPGCLFSLSARPVRAGMTRYTTFPLINSDAYFYVFSVARFYVQCYRVTHLMIEKINETMWRLPFINSMGISHLKQCCQSSDCYKQSIPIRLPVTLMAYTGNQNCLWSCTISTLMVNNLNPSGYETINI